MFKPTFRSLGLPALLAVLITSSAMSAGGDSPMGVWIDDSGQGAVEIKDCSGRLCGQVVWLKSPKNAGRCNLSVIGGLSAMDDGKWGGGWIYDPEAKARFDVEITPVDSGKLKVLGYAGTKTFSRTMTWTKAPEDLKRCDDAAPPIETARIGPMKTPSLAPAVVGAAEKSASKDEDVTMAKGSGQPAAPAKAASRSTSRSAVAHRAATSDKSDKRHAATVKLAELGKYGLQDITLRKSNGGCSLRVSDHMR